MMSSLAISQETHYKTDKAIALAIAKWMVNPKLSLPAASQEIKKLAAYRAAGFRTVVYFERRNLVLVHLTKGPAKFRLRGVTSEGDGRNDVPLWIDRGRLLIVGPDCDCGDEPGDIRLKPKKSKSGTGKGRN